MVRTILEWIDKKMDEIDVSKDKHPWLKALALGFLEGCFEGAVITYPVLVGTLLYIGHLGKTQKD